MFSRPGHPACAWAAEDSYRKMRSASVKIDVQAEEAKSLPASD